MPARTPRCMEHRAFCMEHSQQGRYWQGTESLAWNLHGTTTVPALVSARSSRVVLTCLVLSRRCRPDPADHPFSSVSSLFQATVPPRDRTCSSSIPRRYRIVPNSPSRTSFFISTRSSVSKFGISLSGSVLVRIATAEPVIYLLQKKVLR